MDKGRTDVEVTKEEEGPWAEIKRWSRFSYTIVIYDEEGDPRTSGDCMFGRKAAERKAKRMLKWYLQRMKWREEDPWYVTWKGDNAS